MGSTLYCNDWEATTIVARINALLSKYLSSLRKHGFPSVQDSLVVAAVRENK